jgi:hypothetical protein
VKRAVQTLSIAECEQLVRNALELETPGEILALCGVVAQQHYGDLLG